MAADKLETRKSQFDVASVAMHGGTASRDGGLLTPSLMGIRTGNHGLDRPAFVPEPRPVTSCSTGRVLTAHDALRVLAFSARDDKPAG